MLKTFLLIFFVLLWFQSIAQTDTSYYEPDDTTPVKKKILTPSKKKKFLADTSLKQPLNDTVFSADSSLKTSASATFKNDSTLQTQPDSLKKSVLPAITKLPIDTFYLKMLDNPFLHTTYEPVYLVVSERERKKKDEFFYLTAALLFFIAFIRLVFSNYFINLFKLFWQPSFRQKQTREQLLQNNLPSLLLNLFFILSSGAYISLLLQSGNSNDIHFWRLFLYGSACLTSVYVGKYLFLSFSGWVFNAKPAADAYIFSVYLINKITGILLIPFIVIIAFSEPQIIEVAVPVSITLVCILFVYRYLVSFTPISREIKVSIGHFLLYVLACEVVPLLIIYKTLRDSLSISI